MKKIFIICIALLASLTLMSQSNYYKGFSVGFKEGYCHLKVGCIAPVPPIPPIPGATESIDSYMDGYNKGIVMGYAAQQSEKGISNQQRQQYKTATPEDIDYMSKIDYNSLEGLAKALYNVKATAYRYLIDGEYVAAIITAKKGLSVNPRDDEFMMLIGEGYRRLGDNKNAIKYFKRAYKRNGRSILVELINELKEG